MWLHKSLSVSHVKPDVVVNYEADNKLRRAWVRRGPATKERVKAPKGYPPRSCSIEWDVEDVVLCLWPLSLVSGRILSISFGNPGHWWRNAKKVRRCGKASGRVSGFEFPAPVTVPQVVLPNGCCLVVNLKQLSHFIHQAGELEDRRVPTT